MGLEVKDLWVMTNMFVTIGVSCILGSGVIIKCNFARQSKLGAQQVIIIIFFFFLEALWWKTIILCQELFHCLMTNQLIGEFCYQEPWKVGPW